MTLKTRLAVMMIVLLAAVMATQYLLLQREQRLLAERLSRFGRDIESSTRVLAEKGRWRGSLADSIHVESIVHRIRNPGSMALGDSASMSVVLRIESDSSAFDLADCPPDIRRILESRAGEIGEAGVPDSGRVELLFLGTTGEGEGLFTDAAGVGEEVEEFSETVKIHLAMPGMDGASGEALQLIYPVSDLTDELDRARKRGGLWLAALLAVGATGAVLVAVQFTRPIKALEGSFGRVVDGDLDVSIEPERPDEIGRLTTSFNEMVGRLRDTRQMENRLSEAERLAAVGRLAAGVAHEVRNPLNTMLLTMQQLGAKSAPPPEDPERERFDRYVTSVTGELERLEHLVSTFLELSRSGDLALDRIDVAESVRAAAALFEAEAAGKGVALDVDLPGALEIEADAARLPTIWNNLVSNALEASEPGGSVRLRGRRIGDEVVVEVADDGAGIPVDDRPRIWEPFWTGRPGGTGLGLALVRSVVEHHGGRVEAESEAGTGTTLRVYLPRLAVAGLDADRAAERDPGRPDEEETES